jgi:hypothetical protein
LPSLSALYARGVRAAGIAIEVVPGVIAEDAATERFTEEFPRPSGRAAQRR